MIIAVKYKDCGGVMDKKSTLIIQNLNRIEILKYDCANKTNKSYFEINFKVSNMLELC